MRDTVVFRAASAPNVTFTLVVPPAGRTQNVTAYLDPKRWDDVIIDNTGGLDELSEGDKVLEVDGYPAHLKTDGTLRFCSMEDGKCMADIVDDDKYVYLKIQGPARTLPNFQDFKEGFLFGKETVMHRRTEELFLPTRGIRVELRTKDGELVVKKVPTIGRNGRPFGELQPGDVIQRIEFTPPDSETPKVYDQPDTAVAKQLLQQVGVKKVTLKLKVKKERTK